MCTPHAVANAFIGYAKDENIHLSEIKLHILVYFAQGFSLGMYGQSIYRSADIVAVEKGPVVRPLYDAIRDKYQKGYVGDFLEGEGPEKIDRKHERDIIRAVWLAYKVFSDGDLWRIATKQQSPWAKALKRHPSFSELKEDDMRIFFGELIKESQSRLAQASITGENKNVAVPRT
ncbi:Panacea domain-containing protein [Pseudomonadota bacterium]